MRRKVFVFLLLAVFLFTQVSVVDAKGGSSRSFSSGSRSFSSKSSSSLSKSFGSSSKKSTSGYSGSSGSKSGSFGWSGNKNSSSGSASSKGNSGAASSSSGASKGSSNGYTSSGSTRSKPSSYSASGTPKTNTMKNSYMQDTYKKQASTSNFKQYQQKLNNEQKQAYDSSFNRNYNVGNRMSFEDAMRTRPQRISTYNTRPIFVNVNPVYFGGPLSYGSAFVGPWDLWFLMRASDLFWYHHWHEIYAHRDYFNAAEFAERERAIKTLEAQQIARDANYLDPNFDPDLQFSNDYAQSHVNNLYYTNKYARPGANPIVVLVVIGVVVFVLVLIIRKVSRPKSQSSYQSRLY